MDQKDLPKEQNSSFFDFKKEAAEAYENFPELKENTYFSYFSTTHEHIASVVAPDGLKESHPELYSQRTESVATMTRTIVDEHRKKGYNSAAERLYHDDGARTQAIYLEEESGGYLYAKDPAKGLAFTLDHEMGHLLVPLAMGVDGSYNIHYRECAADAFAAIRTFQRYGNTEEARDIIEEMTMKRSFNAVANWQTEHLTSSVFNQILEDSALTDFSKISFKEGISIAQKYALKHVPTQRDFDNAEPFFHSISFYNWFAVDKRSELSPEDKAESVSIIVDTALSVSDKYAFSIGARMFQPFMSPDNNDLSPEQKQELGGKMAARAREFSLDVMASRLDGSNVMPVKEQIETSKFFAPPPPKESRMQSILKEINNLKKEMLKPITNFKLGRKAAQPAVAKNTKGANTFG